ncbi:MAG: hypothetical protein ACWA5R_10735 [bacterium]
MNKKQIKTDNKSKKTYVKPELKPRGTVFEITQGGRGARTDTARTGSIQLS